MFVLRCGFFLSIVYGAIIFGVGSLHDPHAFAAAVAGEAASAADAAVAQAKDWCAGRPARCARDAARLTALVQATAVEPVSDDGGVELAIAETPAAVPLPIRNPRRRGARVVLTDVR